MSGTSLRTTGGKFTSSAYQEGVDAVDPEEEDEFLLGMLHGVFEGLSPEVAVRELARLQFELALAMTEPEH